MRRFVNWFLQGLILTIPVAVTGYVCLAVLRFVDSLVPLPFPGLGLLIVVAAITLVGWIGSTILSAGAVVFFDGLFDRLPFVRLLYSATKDLLNAFVGSQRRFDRAVTVALSDDGAIRAVGFVTRDALDSLGIADTVAVYLPFSYSVAGHVVLVPAARVTPLPVDGAKALAFVVSGGVSEG